jgi:hypothetical protein
MPRRYRLGRRQASVDRTGARILEAAREVVAESGPDFSVGTLGRRAGVSRATIYNRFGSKGGVLDALRPVPAPEAGDLRVYVERCCAAWALNPAVFRHLPSPGDDATDAPRRIAERLAAVDALRPGCSLKEAEDVIATLTSFAVFDRLHRDGRRSPAAVAEVLLRLARGILA